MNDQLKPRSPSLSLPPGWRRVHETSVGSTQDLARAAAQRNVGSRWLFTADFQTHGRGRPGRTWVAPAGSSLMLTVLLHNESLTPVEHTVLAGVALCQTIEQACGLTPRIKWPNDVLIDEHKVAGILAESSSDSPGYVAIGIGLNTRWGGQRPEGVPSWATSLDEHTSEAVDSTSVLARLVERLDDWLRAVAGEQGSAELWEAWTNHLWRRNEAVRLQVGEDVIEGRIVGCARTGALRVELSDGHMLEIFAGDIALPGEIAGRLLGPRM